MNILTISLLLLTLIAARKKDRCLVNPIFITSSVWLFLLVGYEVVDHGLYPLSDKFYAVLLAWMIPFQIACYTTINMVNNRHHLSHPTTPLITSRYVILFISFCIILVSVMNYKRAMAYDSTNLFHSIRELTVEVKRGNETLAPSAIQVWGTRFAQLSYVMWLIYSLKNIKFKNQYLFYILVFVYLLGGANKGLFVRFFISYMAIQAFKNKIKIRLLAVILGLMFIFMYIAQSLRGGNFSTDESELLSLIWIYIFSPLPAFDTYILHSSTDFTTYFAGEFIFKEFPFVSSFVGGEFKPENVNFYNFEMVYVPMPTNVYTMLSGYWVGWKWSGVIIGGLLHGIFWGYIYKRAQKEDVYKIFYAAISNYLVIWYFHDLLVTQIRFVITLAIFLFLILYNPMFKSRKNEELHF